MSSPESAASASRALPIQGAPSGAPGATVGAAKAPRDSTARFPRGWYDWFDWALVWRYWNGQAEGLRKPYVLEVRELLRLGRHLSDKQLSEKIRMPERTVARWRQRGGIA